MMMFADQYEQKTKTPHNKKKHENTNFCPAANNLQKKP